MKPVYILFVSLFSVSLASAQYIDIHAGAAISSGNFSNSTLSKPEDGFAQNGGSFGFAVNYLVYKNLGICAKFNYSTLGFNIDEYSKQTGDLAPQYTTQSVSTDEQYKSSSALAGGYLTLGKKKLTLDLHVVAGFVSLKTPSLLYTSTYAGSSYSSTSESTHDLAAAIGYGFTLKYVLSKNLYATLHLDNVNANMKFPKYGYQSSKEEIVTKPYQVYSFAVGLGYAIQ
jgi:hypothetical protein